MTPGIEERREVADRLRRLDRTISSHYSTEEAINEFLCALYGNRTFSPIEFSPRNLCGAAATLADLIETERTSRVVTERQPVSQMHELLVESCSECGCVLRVKRHRRLNPCFGERNSSGKEEILNYCPRCGAKVVR